MDALSQTDTLFFGASRLDLDPTSRLLDEALIHTDDGELYLEYVESETLVWDDGKLRLANFDVEQGFGLRGVAGETVAFANASELSMEALRRAVPVLGVLSGGKSVSVAVAPEQKRRALYTSANPLASKGFEEKVALLQKIDAYLRDKEPKVSQVNVSLSGSWKAVQILRADGWRAGDIRPMVRLGVSVVVQKGGRMEGGHAGGGGRFDYTSSFEDSLWKSYADEALAKALVNLESVEAPVGEMTVVLGPGWPSVLIHEAVGHGLEGDVNRKGTSAFAGLMGQKVAADGVTIVDDGTLENRRGSLSIDDEGTPTSRTVLIENGVLVGLMQDRLNARLMGQVSTGNGRRESYSSQPIPRMTNTMMLAGTYDHDEIISSVSKGIYAADFGGGQVDIATGKFVFSATEAYEIEDGRLGRPLKGASLVGTGFETLKRVQMIGNDLKLDNGVGTCGKAGQSVPVGNGQPTLLLDRMTVGGVSNGE